MITIMAKLEINTLNTKRQMINVKKKPQPRSIFKNKTVLKQHGQISLQDEIL